VSPDQAKKIVLGSVAGAGALSAASNLSAGHAPRLRIFIGTMAAGALLAMASEVAPAPAASFALLMLSTAVFVAGADTWKAISRLFA